MIEALFPRGAPEMPRPKKKGAECLLQWPPASGASTGDARNRIGHNAGLSGAQLKTIQEVITLIVFIAFAAVYQKEPVRWNVIAADVHVGRIAQQRHRRCDGAIHPVTVAELAVVEVVPPGAQHLRKTWMTERNRTENRAHH